MANLVLVHSSFRRIVAEEPEFRTDARSSPQWILPRHATDEFANLDIDRWPTNLATSRLPSPVESEALLVPTDDRFGLYDEEHASPIRPETGQPYPEDAVARPQSRALGLVL